MTEDEARQWLEDRVSRETMQRLDHLVALVRSEGERQNLISASTVPQIWSRHIVDSAQLLDSAPEAGRWIDLGSGAGFPGLVVAIIGSHEVTLAEARTRRVMFLRDAVEQLDLHSSVTIEAGRIEMLEATAFDVISARAFAPLDRLLPSALHLSGPSTRWVLPKGRGAQAELDTVRRSWQGDFRIVPSVTDPAAAIIVAEQVRIRRGVRNAGSMR